MKVNIEEIAIIRKRLIEIDQTSIDDIEWYKDGVKIDPTEEQLEEWKFLGLSNSYFPDYMFDEGFFEVEEQ